MYSEGNQPPRAMYAERARGDRRAAGEKFVGQPEATMASGVADLSGRTSYRKI